MAGRRPPFWGAGSTQKPTQSKPQPPAPSHPPPWLQLLSQMVSRSPITRLSQNYSLLMWNEASGLPACRHKSQNRPFDGSKGQGVSRKAVLKILPGFAVALRGMWRLTQAGWAAPKPWAHCPQLHIPHPHYSLAPAQTWLFFFLIKGIKKNLSAAFNLKQSPLSWKMALPSLQENPVTAALQLTVIPVEEPPPPHKPVPSRPKNIKTKLKTQEFRATSYIRSPGGGGGLRACCRPQLQNLWELEEGVNSLPTGSFSDVGNWTWHLQGTKNTCV